MHACSDPTCEKGGDAAKCVGARHARIHSAQKKKTSDMGRLCKEMHGDTSQASDLSVSLRKHLIRDSDYFDTDTKLIMNA